MFADGSVKTISAKIAPKVLRNLATIHGTDSIDLLQQGEMIK
jgi:hypothetical protein